MQVFLVGIFDGISEQKSQAKRYQYKDVTAIVFKPEERYGNTLAGRNECLNRFNSVLKFQL